MTGNQKFGQSTLFFLEAAYIQESCRLLRLPQPVTLELIEVANRVRKDTSFLALVVNNQRSLLEREQQFERWPESPFFSGQSVKLVNLLVLLSGLPQLNALYAERKIPEQVMTGTLSDIVLHLHKHYEKHKLWGIDKSDFNWLTYHMCGDLYRLGRLQFMHRKFPEEFRVFRNRSQKKVVMLVAQEMTFRSDGQINCTGGITDTNGMWTSQFQCDAMTICGNPVDPATGSALPIPLTLNRQEWTEALRPGDWCLDVHIPEGDGLSIEACYESFQEARKFFAKHFPEREFKSFVCVSWICDAQLEKWLPVESNIVRWLREFYLFPVVSDQWSIVRSVFGLNIPYGWQGHLDLTQLPQHTSLQRAIVAHFKQGGHWRKAGALLFSDDVDEFRNQFYRRHSIVEGERRQVLH